MAYLLGGLVGGLIAIYLLSVLWEWALFKRVMDDPVAGKLSSVMAAWITAGILGGLGGANGGPFYWAAFAVYLVPAGVVAAFGYRRGLQIREEVEAEHEGTVEPFR